MSIKFNQLKSNCYYVEIENIVLLISYESIIGFIYNDILYLNEYYIKYSKTTSRHINLFKQNLIYTTEKTITNTDMYLIFKDMKINLNIIE